MSKKFALSLIFVSLIMILSACSTSYDDMIGSFNGKYFSKGYVAPEPYTTSSSNFDEKQMLDDVVSMIKDSMTLLAAPDGGEGSTYEWKAYVPHKNEDGTEEMKEVVIGNEKLLAYTAPGVFNEDKENKLTVIVTEKNGKQYTDTAKVFITIE